MIAIAAALALSASFASPPPVLAAEFRTRDQALLDAVTSGNRALWSRVMSPDSIYVDEDGNITTRSDLLAQIVPLGAGSSGRITITSFTLHASNDIAITVHKDHETENWHGQNLTADYITTETWRREGGDWKLILTHVYVVAKDPPHIQMPASRLAELVGRYQAGPGVVAVVNRDGDHLTLQDRKKPAKPLLFEAQDVLFVPGEPRFHDFVQRDGHGRISDIIQRREGEDVRWTRLP